MLSSNTKNWLIILLIGHLFLLASCSYFFDEKEKESEVDYKGTIGTCVTPSSQQIRNYFDANSTLEVDSQKLRIAFSCFQETITSFRKNTKSGRLRQDEYTPENIYKFLNKFYEDFGLSQERIAAYFRIKAFLFGGNPETITKQELQLVFDALPVLSEMLANLAKDRKILLRQTEISRNEEGYRQFREAFKNFKFEFGRFMAVLDEHSGERHENFGELVSFIISELFKDELAQQNMSLIPAGLAFKKFVTNSDSEKIDRQNLNYFLRQSILTYEAFSQYHYFLIEEDSEAVFTKVNHIISFVTRIPSMLRDSSVFKGVALKSMTDIIDNLQAVLTYSVRNQKDLELPYQRVEDLVYGFHHSEMIDKGMAKALSLFLKLFGKKWLDPYQQGIEGLNLGKVHYIRSLIDEWIGRQQIANTLFLNSRNKEISLLDLERGLPNNKKLDEWVALLKKVSVHQWDKQGRVLYTNNLRNFTYEELTASNSLISLGSLFLKPYNVDVKKPKDFRLKENDAQEVYLVLRTLGVEMAFMDSRIFDSGLRAFMEGNNFSSQQRNDDSLDFYESYEYLSVALASGQLADRIYSEIPERCHLDYKDVHHNYVTNKSCYDEHIAENFEKYFGHLPVIINFWKESSNVVREKFFGTLEVASRSGTVTERPVDLGEIRILVSVNYYLQAIFNMFDYNKDGLATNQELVDAERHFRPMVVDFLANKNPNILASNRGKLRSLICPHVTKSEGDFFKSKELKELAECIAPRVYIHLLKTGSIPSGLSFNSVGFIADNISTLNLIRATSSKNPADRIRELRTLEANPRTVLRVFSALARVTHDGHVAQIQKFLMNGRIEFLTAISMDEAPECMDRNAEKPFTRITHPFCEWARVIYCNETVNENVYQYFKQNKYNLFPQAAWEEDPGRATFDAMKQMYFTFKGHRQFSTHCAFPSVEDSYWSGLGKTLSESFSQATKPVVEEVLGDKENEGWFDDLWPF